MGGGVAGLVTHYFLVLPHKKHVSQMGSWPGELALLPDTLNQVAVLFAKEHGIKYQFHFILWCALFQYKCRLNVFTCKKRYSLLMR